MSFARPALLAAGALVAVGSLLAMGCGASPTPGPPPAAAVVDIKNIAFNPKTVTVHAGSVVAWKFDDGAIAHNVVGDHWRSPDRTGGYDTHTFTTPGTYAYRCTLHSAMDGVVEVNP